MVAVVSATFCVFRDYDTLLGFGVNTLKEGMVGDKVHVRQNVSFSTAVLTENLCLCLTSSLGAF